MGDAEHAGALVARARDGEDAAWRELIAELYPLVAKIARAHRPRRVAEEDLCQMIFVKVFRNLGQYSGKVPISHWVSRIAVNECRNQLAAEKARPELRQADLSPEQEALVQNLAATTEELPPDRHYAARDLVEKLLSSLKPMERLVVDMLYLQEKSVAEIQKLTGWTASAVKVRAFRARQKLRRQIGGLL
ncbi:MAG: sigma-70 family RNA polymerase sigma factor [Verrucomicrobia bacterium]|nr:sigma-70 family RNA polymerase sigma factor [Verrucomicrobiota bacterium]